MGEGVRPLSLSDGLVRLLCSDREWVFVFWGNSRNDDRECPERCEVDGKCFFPFLFPQEGEKNRVSIFFRS